MSTLAGLVLSVFPAGNLKQGVQGEDLRARILAIWIALATRTSLGEKSHNGPSNLLINPLATVTLAVVYAVSAYS